MKTGLYLPINRMVSSHWKIVTQVVTDLDGELCLSFFHPDSDFQHLNYTASLDLFNLSGVVIPFDITRESVGKYFLIWFRVRGENFKPLQGGALNAALQWEYKERRLISERIAKGKLALLEGTYFAKVTQSGGRDPWVSIIHPNNVGVTNPDNKLDLEVSLESLDHADIKYETKGIQWAFPSSYVGKSINLWVIITSYDLEIVEKRELNKILYFNDENMLLEKRST